MSALPPKADIRCSARHVRLVPQADIRTASFDQLSGNGEPGIVRPSVFAVVRLMTRSNFVGYRDIGRLRTAKNFVDQVSRALEQVWEVWAIGQKTSDFNKTSIIKNRWQARSQRKCDDARAIRRNAQACLGKLSGASDLLITVSG